MDNVGKHLKLTKGKILLKMDDDNYTIWSLFDNKRVQLTLNNIDILRSNIVEKQNGGYSTSLADAVLEKYMLKHCVDKDYYAVANRGNLLFVMGLQLDTIKKITNYYNLL